MGATHAAVRTGFREQLLPFAHCPSLRVGGHLPYHLAPEMAGLFECRGSLQILDIGCGLAQNRAYFAAKRHRYVGLDIATPQADVRADALALPFLDRTFDAIITIAALQYTLAPLHFLMEAHRVLKPRGTITGTVAFLEPWTYAGLVHFTPGGLLRLLEKAGFQAQHIWPGWRAEMAVETCAFRPATCLGRTFGCFLYLVHQAWWSAMNKARLLLQRPTRHRCLHALEFAGSLNFHAIKGDARGSSA